MHYCSDANNESVYIDIRELSKLITDNRPSTGSSILVRCYQLKEKQIDRNNKPPMKPPRKKLAVSIDNASRTNQK